MSSENTNHLLPSGAAIIANYGFCSMTTDVDAVIHAAFFKETMSNGNFEKAYRKVGDEEMRSKELLVQFEADYSKVTNTENVNIILANLKRKKNKEQNR